MAFFRQTFVDGVTVVTASWLNGIQEVVGASAIVPEYSPQVFQKGALVSHDNKLYISKQAIPTPEAWTASHWTETNFEALLNEKQDVAAVITNEEIDALYGS